MNLSELTRMYETEPDTEFFPVPVSSIDLTTVSRFDLYLSVRPDEPLVLYSQKGNKLDSKIVEEMQSMQVSNLFVPAQQVEDFRHFVEGNLPSILADRDASLDQKSELLYACASHTVKTILDTLGDKESIRRGKEMINHTARFMISNDDVLQCILKLISKTYSISAHSTNGCFMSIALAKQLGIDDPGHLRQIGLGAMLRDLGMTMLDVSILETRGQLSMDEFRQVKQHPVFGETMVQDMDVVSDIERGIIRQHHERLDGSGYPNGVTGKNIPMHVRIVSIADVFCALTADRPFQPRKNSFDALKFMSETMKKELDIKLIKSLIKILGIEKQG